MLVTWVFVAILAEATTGTLNPGSQATPSNQPVVVSLSGAAMTCTRQGDHLVCVLPLNKDAAQDARPAAAPVEPPPVAAPIPQPPAVPVRTNRAAKPSVSTLALPGPEAAAQLKKAEANIALAKSLLPKAKTPQEAILAQQMLYWANEQYRTARALLHTVDGDLRSAPDPFDSEPSADDGNAIALCQSEPDGCNTAAP